MSPVPAEEPKVRAERLFAGLTGQAVGPGGASRRTDAEAPAPTGTENLEADALTQRELRDFLLAARTAIERTAKAVRVVRARVTNTTAEVRALGEAIEEALVATNDRLTRLEQHVLGEIGFGAEAADDAMRRLHRTLRAVGNPPES